MGYAIQRGATCTVAAVDEVVSKRSFNRLSAMVEASIWVAGRLVLAETFHLLGQMPSGYPLSYLTVVGGVLLGLGAYINRACVFGAIARFGSGEWAYIATPIGIYVGSLIVAYGFSPPALASLPYGSPVLVVALWLALPFMAFLLWRLIRALLALVSEGSNEPVFARLRSGFATRVWEPHAATTVIGITFFFMFLLVGAWDYTAVLADSPAGCHPVCCQRYCSSLHCSRARHGAATPRAVSQHPRFPAAGSEMLRRRCADGMGGLARPRAQRRTDPDWNAVAVAICMGGVSDDVPLDRCGNDNRTDRRQARRTGECAIAGLGVGTTRLIGCCAQHTSDIDSRKDTVTRIDQITDGEHGPKQTHRTFLQRASAQRSIQEFRQRAQPRSTNREQAFRSLLPDCSSVRCPGAVLFRHRARRWQFNDGRRERHHQGQERVFEGGYHCTSQAGYRCQGHPLLRRD